MNRHQHTRGGKKQNLFREETFTFSAWLDDKPKGKEETKQKKGVHERSEYLTVRHPVFLSSMFHYEDDVSFIVIIFFFARKD